MRDQNRRHRRCRNAQGKISPNLTSCIDVVFLLLIFFLTTANFAEGEGVITTQMPGVPNCCGDPEPPSLPIRLIVSTYGTSGCRLQIEQHPIAPHTFSELSKLLRDMQYNSKVGRSGPFGVDTPVEIVVHQGIRWQHVVNAFNAAVAAGYQRVQFGQPPVMN